MSPLETVLKSSRAFLDALREVDAAERANVPHSSKTYTERLARARKAASVARRDLAGATARAEGKTDEDAA